MVDPGRSYLYGRRESRPGPAAGEEAPTTPTLAMSALPVPRLSAGSGGSDWQAAIGNMENAKLALDTLKSLVSDAVFLDEEAFTNANTLSLYQQRIQVGGARGELPGGRAAAAADRPGAAAGRPASQRHRDRSDRRPAAAALALRPPCPSPLPPSPPHPRPPRPAPPMLQAQQRKARELEHQIEALRAEAEGREEALQREVQARKAVQQHVRELQAELDNNAGGLRRCAGAGAGAAAAAAERLAKRHANSHLANLPRQQLLASRRRQPIPCRSRASLPPRWRRPPARRAHACRQRADTRPLTRANSPPLQSCSTCTTRSCSAGTRRSSGSRPSSRGWAAAAEAPEGGCGSWSWQGLACLAGATDCRRCQGGAYTTGPRAE
jgi:hypothetical protein